MRTIVVKNDLPITGDRFGGIRNLVLFVVLSLTCVSFRAEGAPGDVVLGFDAGVNDSAHGTSEQPDGRTLLGGGYALANGTPRQSIARLNANGTLDLAFDPNANHQVRGVVVLPDGKILISGFFTTMGGVTRNHIARLNADGTLDAAFDPNVDGRVYSMALQTDGKILIGGVFTTVGGVGRNCVARLHANGSLDMGFDAALVPEDGLWVPTVAVQADGKIIIGGYFTAVAGMPRNNIARLEANGTLDPGFNPDVNGFFTACIAEQPDGRIVIGGRFTTVGGELRNSIARLNADGSLDSAFNADLSGTLVRTVTLQADGKIVFGGLFTAVSGITRNNIARLNADGTLDAAFDPNADDFVEGATVLENGRILVAGSFAHIGGVPRAGVALLDNDAATQNLTVPNLSRIDWLRGGASPETLQVTFELSTDGGTSYALLGAGARINGGWELTGLNLPSIGHLRARARTTSGSYNGFSGLVETVTGFGPNPNDQDNDGLLDSWELTYWPSLNGHNPQDDADGDGHNELLELALGLNPTTPNPGGLPPVTTEGGYLTMTITKHAGVTYEVQSAGTLLPGQPDSFSAATTTVLINNATTLKVRDNFPTATSPPRFMRVKVTAAP